MYARDYCTVCGYDLKYSTLEGEDDIIVFTIGVILLVCSFFFFISLLANSVLLRYRTYVCIVQNISRPDHLQRDDFLVLLKGQPFIYVYFFPFLLFFFFSWFIIKSARTTSTEYNGTNTNVAFGKWRSTESQFESDGSFVTEWSWLFLSFQM